MDSEHPGEVPPSIMRLLAHFADDQTVGHAVRALETKHLSVERLEVLAPRRSRFRGITMRAWPGLLGGLCGAVLGGTLTLSLRGLREVERGSQTGSLLEKLLMAALLGGLLGLMVGLGVIGGRGASPGGEQRRAGSERPAYGTEAPETLLRIRVPAERASETRRMLEHMGADSVEEESRSRWWDRAG